MYKPIDQSLQMTTPAKYQPCTIETVGGRSKKVYSETDEFVVMGHYKEQSGSEYEVNGLKVVNKTITYTCWYDPRIKADGRLIIYDRIYDIDNAEDVEMRHRYMVCSLTYVGAGA